jgi:hypothetical protein
MAPCFVLKLYKSKKYGSTANLTGGAAEIGQTLLTWKSKIKNENV